MLNGCAAVRTKPPLARNFSGLSLAELAALRFEYIGNCGLRYVILALYDPLVLNEQLVDYVALI
jgi:hypothetical protein